MIMLSLLNKKWRLAKPDTGLVEEFVHQANIPHLLARLLANRKFQSAEECRFFLDADLARLHDPYLMHGMKPAVDRVVRAIESGERITVFGDYDVDGVTSAAFLVHFFRDLDAPISYYLPDRLLEGYGVNENALREIRSRGCSLVITADCGITAVREVRVAREIGLDVIVTDHHQIGEEGLPDAVAVLNPHQPDCEYPFRFLSGVGIVFKLATAVRSALHQAGWDKERLPNLKRHLDLFALGTIADVAPLTGENHVLCRHGLDEISVSRKPGLLALKTVADLNGTIDSRSVGFGLGPRLNASGRMGKADVGLHLLTCSDMKEATELAHQVNDFNKERQEAQRWTEEEAEYVLQREIDLERERVIVLASENFHRGVMGIVAARLTERYYRPTILIALEEGVGRGSARSIPTFNLFKALSECAEWFHQFGGHAYAAGLSIDENKIESFKLAINEIGDRFLTPDDLIPEISIDAILDLEDITLAEVKKIQAMEPFGAENPAPVFLSRKVALRDVQFIGKDGSHVRFKALQGNAQPEGIAFNFRDAFQYLDTRENLMDLVYEIEINRWNGNEKVQLKLLDMVPSSQND